MTRLNNKQTTLSVSVILIFIGVFVTGFIAKASSAQDGFIVVQASKTENLEDVLLPPPARAILVGETHTSFADHLLQLGVIRKLHENDVDFAIGVEWIQRPYQPVLDDYIAGRIDEKTMLRQTEYYQRWRFDYRLFRDIFRFAQEHKIKLIALNADKKLTDKIMHDGIDGLSTADKAKLPQNPIAIDPAYAKTLKSVMGMHPNRDPDDPAMLKRFIEVQSTWDEVMADSAANYLNEHPTNHIVILAGRGHTHPFAIPPRITQKTGQATLSIARYQAESAFNEADYWILSEKIELPTLGLLGVSVVQNDIGLELKHIADDSNATEAGLKVGETIVAINDVAVKDYTDLKWALMDVAPGDEVQLLIVHDAESADESRSVTLAAIAVFNS